MAARFVRQVAALQPLRAQVPCAYCATVTWWEKRPELVYRGSHRYARWVCAECGRTSERARAYANGLAVTQDALRAGPGTQSWRAYTQLETCF